jgi:hypothetical protein
MLRSWDQIDGVAVMAGGALWNQPSRKAAKAQREIKTIVSIGGDRTISHEEQIPGGMHGLDVFFWGEFIRSRQTQGEL